MNRLFKYKAKDFQGKTVTGSHRGSSKRDVAVFLHNQNLVAIEILEEKKAALYLNKNLYFRLRPVSIEEFSQFSRRFHILLSAGVPIIQCLEMLREQTKDQGFSRDILGVCNRIREGEGLSQAMGAYPKSFSTLFVFMVEAGEMSGNLSEILLEMAAHYETEEKNRSQILQMIFYPIILVFVSLGVVVFLLTNVLPTFVAMFEAIDAPLPEPTRILLGISETLTRDWFKILLMIMGGVFFIGLVSEMPRVAGFIDSFKMKLPVLGRFNQKRCLVMLAKTLALLLNSGIDLLSALNRLDGVTENRFIKKEVRKLVKKVSGGSMLSQAMEESIIFPSLFCQMVRIGEASGSLPEVLEKITLIYDEEVKKTMNLMRTALEPFIILILGGGVLFILAAIMLPVFDIYTAYSGM